ncbi:hypothetical protein BGW80DRAFT_375202 [Lactifluus volemus]|nr:hypothetical protein BGW80DRAFT_375202 [Lactifluus volemus]
MSAGMKGEGDEGTGAWARVFPFSCVVYCVVVCDSNMRILYMASPKPPQLKSYGLISEWTICQNVPPPSLPHTPSTYSIRVSTRTRRRSSSFGAHVSPAKSPIRQGDRLFLQMILYCSAILVLVLGAKSSAPESTLVVELCTAHTRYSHFTLLFFFFLRFVCILAI